MARRFLLLFLICLLPVFAYGQQQSPTPFPPVYFNHLFILLDEQTYDDINQSEFVRDHFASFELRTTHTADGGSWSGAYVYGEQTCIEFFSIEKDSGVRPGTSGIGLGVDKAGDIEAVFTRLSERIEGKVQKGLITRKIEGKEIPWFYSVGIDYQDSISNFAPWIMEYHQDYLKTVHSDLSPEEDGITRKQYLMRRIQPDRYLGDIYEVTIALDETDADRFEKQLAAFDYKVEEQGARKACVGPGIKFTIIPQTVSAYGVTEIKMSLLRNREGEKTYRFGAKSVLKLNGRTATWTF